MINCKKRVLKAETRLTDTDSESLLLLELLLCSLMIHMDGGAVSCCMRNHFHLLACDCDFFTALRCFSTSLNPLYHHVDNLQEMQRRRFGNLKTLVLECSFLGLKSNLLRVHFTNPVSNRYLIFKIQLLHSQFVLVLEE